MLRSRMTRGLFVTFEGLDGCGKSTQVRLAADRLASQNFPVVVTREPGGTCIAEKIRALLMDPSHESMVDECEVLLYLAARAQHVRETILPAVSRGKLVLCDRFEDATFAYQGSGRGISLETLRMLNDFSTGGIRPDLTFIFDIPVETVFERLNAMNKPADRLESGGREFFERVREGYRTLARDGSGRIRLLDGALPIEQLAGAVCSDITAHI